MRGRPVAERVEDTRPGVDAPRASGQTPRVPTTPRPPGAGEVGPREHLSKLQGLFVLAQLMAESRDEDHLVRLAGSAVPSLGPFRLLGIHLRDGGWCDLADAIGSPQDQTEMERSRASTAVRYSASARETQWPTKERCRPARLSK